MTSPSSLAPQAVNDLAKRDLAEYGVVRLRDQVFDAVLALWRRRNAEGWTQKKVAEIIDRDPAWVSRNLRAPGNWTLRTAGELIQGLDGEAEVSISALEDPVENPRNYDAYDGYIQVALPKAGYTTDMILRTKGTIQIIFDSDNRFQVQAGVVR